MRSRVKAHTADCIFPATRLHCALPFVVSCALALLLHARPALGYCGPSPDYPNLCAQNGGAVVESSPTVFIAWWGWAHDNNAARIDPADEATPVHDLLGTAGYGGTKWLGTVTQYHDLYNGVQGQATGMSRTNLVAGEWDTVLDPWAPLFPANPTDDDYSRLAMSAAEHFGVDPRDDRNIFLILKPPGAVPFVGFSGEHSDSLGVFGPGCPGNCVATHIILNYLGDYPDFGARGCSNITCGLTALLSHELAEDITDPVLRAVRMGWTDNAGHEIADKCEEAPLKQTIYYPGSEIGWGPEPQRILSTPQLWSNRAHGGTGGCVTSYTQRNDIFFVGQGDLWHQSTDASLWLWGAPPGVTLASSPGAVSWGPKRVDVFIRDSNNHLQHAFSDDPDNSFAWDDWGPAPPGFTFTEAPAVASPYARRLDLFAKGNTPSGYPHLFHYVYDNGYYSGWQDLGGGDAISTWLQLGLGAASWTDGTPDEVRLDVFMWGFQWSTSTFGLVHVYFATDSDVHWELWPSPPGTGWINGDIAASSWMPQRLDVVTVDQESGDLWQRFWDNSGFVCGGFCEGWTNLGHPPGVGFSTARPGTAGMGQGRWWFQATGTNGVLYTRFWDYGADSDWWPYKYIRDPRGSAVTSW